MTTANLGTANMSIPGAKDMIRYFWACRMLMSESVAMCLPKPYDVETAVSAMYAMPTSLETQRFKLALLFWLSQKRQDISIQFQAGHHPRWRRR